MHAFLPINAPPLCDYVHSMWISEGYFQPHTRERIMPTAAMDLIIDLEQGGASVFGPRSKSIILDSSGTVSIIAVHFRPGGGFAFFGRPASEVKDTYLPLDSLWGQAANELCHRLLEVQEPHARFQILSAFLLQRLDQHESRNAAVRYAVQELQNSTAPMTVAAVVDRTGYSTRHFIDLFRHEVGLTPKLFHRMARFRYVLTTLETQPNPHWADIAQLCGYFDQAHFIHDFREFAGVTPSSYLRHRTSINHIAMVDRS